MKNFNDGLNRKIMGITNAYDVVKDLVEKTNNSIPKSIMALAGISNLVDNDLYNYSKNNYNSNHLAPSILTLTNSVADIDYLINTPKNVISDLINVNQFIIDYHFPWQNNFPKAYFDNENSSIKSLMGVVNSFQNHLDYFTNINNSFVFSKNNTITDGLKVAMNLDLEQYLDSNDIETEKKSIEKIVETTNQFIEEVQFESNQLYEKLNEYLIFLFSGLKSENTRKFLKDLMINLITTFIISMITPNTGNTNIENQNNNSSQNISNTTINNGDVNIYQTINVQQTSVDVDQDIIQTEINFVVNEKYFATHDKIITHVKSRNAKIIALLPTGTKVTILKKYRTWLIVSFLDSNNKVIVGYTTTDNLIN
jgi:hypothetical protein